MLAPVKVQVAGAIWIAGLAAMAGAQTVLIPPVATDRFPDVTWSTGCGGVAGPVVNDSFEAEVVEIVNAERRANGNLPPLKRVSSLDEIARYHAADLATDDYFFHETYDRVNSNLVYVCEFWQRVTSWYPGTWVRLAENIAAGSTTPADVMGVWMGSPGHRANILDANVWEIGVGYFATGGTYGRYWVQDFGKRSGIYPLIINDEARTTTSANVTLYMYGAWTEVRLKNDGGAWSAWQAFSSTKAWTLPATPGTHVVYGEMRTASASAAASDSIVLLGASALDPVEMGADRHSGGGSTGNGNGVIDPGEAVIVDTTWQNLTVGSVAATGVVSGFVGPAGASYSIADSTAGFGTVAAGFQANCFTATGNCYQLSVSNPASRPASHWDATFVETINGTTPKTWTLHIGDSFTDVPRAHWAYRFVETIYHNGITSGCGAALYCPDTPLSRAEMAVLLLMAEHGSGWTPPLSTGAVFTDVPIDHWAGDFIEELAAEGITSGCGAGLYCPNNPITRAEMAVFLLAAEHGQGWTPPLSTGLVFADVPIDHWAGDFIEQLAAEGITSGCGGGLYCPNGAVTRAEMAVFLTATFSLTLY